MKKNRAIQVLLILCVLLQGVAVMPHHHHVDRRMACFNVLHSLDYQRDMCPLALTGQVHEHASENGPSCQLGRLVVIQPSRQDARTGAAAISSPDVLSVLFPGIYLSADQVPHPKCGLHAPRPVFATPLHAAYLAGAVSPRAPSDLG